MDALPQYAKLHHQLKKKIQTGDYRQGDLLPSEHELCSSYQLARSTVRQALNELSREGYIRKIKGKGSLITSPVRSLGLLSFRGFSEVIGATNQPVRTDILRGPHATSWHPQFFYPLTGDEINAGCIEIERLRYVKNDPVMWEFTYLPNDLLPGFLQKSFVNNSLFQTLSRFYQVEMVNLEQDIRAIEATEKAAKQLNMQPGKPVMYIIRKYYTNHPQISIYSALFCNTEKYAIGNSVSQ